MRTGSEYRCDRYGKEATQTDNKRAGWAASPLLATQLEQAGRTPLKRTIELMGEIDERIERWPIE